MLRDYRITKHSDTVYRIWNSLNPGEQYFTSLSGVCSCQSGRYVYDPCGHWHIVNEFLNPVGVTVEKARKIARRVLACLAGDLMIRRNSCRKPVPRKPDGLITHIEFDSRVRGKGTPTRIEGAMMGVNIVLHVDFDINTKSYRPPAEVNLLKNHLFPKWEKLNV